MEHRSEIVERIRSVSLENGYELGYRRKKDELTDWETGSIQRILGKTRLFLAVFLVIGVIALDHFEESIGDLNAEKVYQMIEVDYEDIIIDKVMDMIKTCQSKSL